MNNITGLRMTTNELALTTNGVKMVGRIKNKREMGLAPVEVINLAKEVIVEDVAVEEPVAIEEDVLEIPSFVNKAYYEKRLAREATLTNPVQRQQIRRNINKKPSLKKTLRKVLRELLK